jgi:archaellum component FlaG (FlaF/FlaG flagellin family)
MNLKTFALIVFPSILVISLGISTVGCDEHQETSSNIRVDSKQLSSSLEDRIEVTSRSVNIDLSYGARSFVCVIRDKKTGKEFILTDNSIAALSDETK